VPGGVPQKQKVESGMRGRRYLYIPHETNKCDVLKCSHEGCCFALTGNGVMFKSKPPESLNEGLFKPGVYVG